MNKFQEYKIEVSYEDKKIIETYLSKIQDFVKEKSLEQELYDDIEERFFEKLSENKNLNKVEIKKIIAEIGEVEDIFVDVVVEEDDELLPQEQENPKQNKYISFAIIIFWALVLMIIIGTTSVYSVFLKIFIIIAIIFLARWTMQYGNIPGAIKKDIRKYKNYLTKIIKPKYYSLALILAVILFSAGGVIPPNVGIVFFLIIGIYYIISMLLKKENNFVKSIFHSLFQFFRFAFFTSFGVIFIIWTLLLLALAGAYFTDFHYEGIQLFSHFPIYFAIGLLFGIFALIVFSVSFISYGFSKKGFGKSFLLFGILSFFIAVFCAFSTGFDLYKKYSYSEEIQKTYEFDIKNTDEIYHLNFLDLTSVSSKINYNFGYFKYIELKKSKDDKLRLTAKIEINTAKEDMKFFQENISAIILKQEKNNLFFNFQDQTIFGNKTLPLFFGLSHLEIEIPENMVFTSLPYKFVSQVDIPKKYKYLEPYITTNYCKSYFYDKDVEHFSCNIDEKDIKNAQDMMKIEKLYKNLSNLSPIKHKDDYKRTYYLEFYHHPHSDWELDYKSVELGSGTINFTYKDQSLEMKAKVKYIEDADGHLTFSDFEIIKSNINANLFKMKYYEKGGLHLLFQNNDNIKIAEELKIVELLKQISELSPIKHKDDYKRNYYNNIVNKYNDYHSQKTIDWDLDNLSVQVQSGAMNFTYKDQSLNIKAKVKYAENTDLHLNFSDFEILEITRNEGVFDDKYYTNESLKYIFK